MLKLIWSQIFISSSQNISSQGVYVNWRVAQHSLAMEKVTQNSDEADSHIHKLQEILRIILKSNVFLTFPPKWIEFG